MSNQNCEAYHQQLSELKWKLDELSNSIGWVNHSIDDIDTAIQWKLKELEELKQTKQQHYYKKKSIAQNITTVKRSMQQITNAMWDAGCSGY